jgi:GTP cyclohydrolase I
MTLGDKIHQLLLKHNLENPILFGTIDKWADAKYIQLLETKLADFLKSLGFDLANESLINTPSRVVNLFIHELFYGLNYANFPDISATPNQFTYTTPLWSEGISVSSTCEHHLVPIKGFAVVGYIPNSNIVGLSKINQVVDFFSHRPQVQERLTRQVFLALQEVLDTKSVAVAIKATHDCITERGIKDKDSQILTLEAGGRFATNEVLNLSFNQLAMSIKC